MNIQRQYEVLTKLFILNTPDSRTYKKFNTILESTGNIKIAFLDRFQYDVLIAGLTFNKKLTEDEIFSVDCELHGILFENKKRNKSNTTDEQFRTWELFC